MVLHLILLVLSDICACSLTDDTLIPDQSQLAIFYNLCDVIRKEGLESDFLWSRACRADGVSKKLIGQIR